MASGTKFWQEYWEAVLKEVAENLLRVLHFSNTNHRALLLGFFHDDRDYYREVVRRRLQSHDNSFLNISSCLTMQQYSMSRIPIYIGLSLAVIWFTMSAMAINIDLFGIVFDITGF